MGKRIRLAIALALGGAGHAAAGLLPVHVEVTPAGADYRYTYSIQLQSGAVLQSGDYFTIFDFAGLVPTPVAQSIGFGYGTATAGPVPSRLNPLDDAGVANLTWTYQGETKTGPLDLGDFSAVSHYGHTTDGAFAAQTHRQVDGHVNANVTDTRVPVPMAPGVPEPSSLVLVMLGLPLALALSRLARRWA
jgi:hypothetical protein